MTYNFSPDVLKLNPELADIKTESASKYRNARTEASGMRFQSGREAAGVSKLILLEQAKQIFSLRLQVKFPVASGVSYIADAVYLDSKLQVRIVDFKGFKTKEYRIKKKLFEERYGIAIEEA